jgi:hypothetical protein
MTRHLTLTLAVALLAASPSLAAAQQVTQAGTQTTTIGSDVTAADTTVAAKDSTAPVPKKANIAALLYRPIELQHVRPADQRGINVFEAPKEDALPFTGMKLVWGGAFTQQFQGLQHKNSAAAKVANGVNSNQLIGLGHGFNTAVANLNLGLQLAPGIRVALSTYASSRHHNETWVKDGYFLMDASPIDHPVLNTLMQYLTVKVGHFEINYGDQHFRRTDNGNAIYNPFVGNLIMDAFTTEIGGEVYLRANGFMGMVGMTGGEVKGQTTAPEKRSPTYLAKLGYDKQLSPTLRTRLTGSMYTKQRSASNTLFTGDRAGSRYYNVLENTAATEAAQAWSGNVRPGFSDKVTAMVINPFVKVKGLELFGNLEQAKGRTATETAERTWTQYSGEAVYRFLPREQMYLAGRYNVAKGELTGITNEVSSDRLQIGGGWFVTPALLAKIEWVTQKYNDFPTSDIRNGGKFKGFMFEGVVAF